MDIMLLTVLIISAFLLIIGSSVLPNPKWIIFTSGCIFLLVGVLSIANGIELGATILKTGFVTNMGILFSLFGSILNVQAVF